MRQGLRFFSVTNTEMIRLLKAPNADAEVRWRNCDAAGTILEKSFNFQRILQKDLVHSATKLKTTINK